jgi:hypothetical protein
MRSDECLRRDTVAVDVRMDVKTVETVDFFVWRMRVHLAEAEVLMRLDRRTRLVGPFRAET